MGRPMTRHPIRAGHAVTVSNRTRSRAGMDWSAAQIAAENAGLLKRTHG